MTTRKRALHTVLGVVVASSLSIPTPPPLLSAIVLTKTSASTVNPPEWDSDFTGYQLWDGINNGDKHLMRWRRTIGSGAWTTEAEQGLDDEVLTGGFTWPLFEAAKPLAGGAFEAQEQRVRYAAGVEIGRSAWSINSITDAALAAPAFVPSSLYGAGDIGYAWDTTDLSKIWVDAAGTVAGSFGSGVGRITDISGKGNNILDYADDTSRPALVNVSGGLVSFDGVNDKLKGIGGFYAKGSMTWIGIVKGLDAAFAILWAECNTGLLNPSYAPGTRCNGNTTQMLNFQKNDAAAQIANAMAAPLMDNAAHVLFVTDDGATVSVSVAGAAFVTNAYVRSGVLTLNESSFGTSDSANNNVGGFATFNLGSGMVISRVLAGTLGTAGTEKTNAYNYFAAKHGLPQL